MDTKETIEKLYAKGESTKEACEKYEIAKKLYFEGEPQKKIAEKLGISYSTLRSKKSREKWTVKTEKKVATKKRNKKSVATQIIEAVEEPKNLTPKQKLFCEYYVRNFNGTQAAIKAGYSKATAYSIANSLLKKVEIQEYIKELKYAKMAIANLDADDLVEMWMRIAFADLTDYIDFGPVERVIPVYDEDGNEITTYNEKGEKIPVYNEYGKYNNILLKNSSMVDGQILSALSEGRDGITIKLADKAKALTFLSNYFDLNPQHKHRKTYDNARLELEERKLNKEGFNDEKVQLNFGGENELKD